MHWELLLLIFIILVLGALIIFKSKYEKFASIRYPNIMPVDGLVYGPWWNDTQTGMPINQQYATFADPMTIPIEDVGPWELSSLYPEYSYPWQLH